MDSTSASATLKSPADVDRRGVTLVAASALVWSFGGAIARGIGLDDDWTVVFWRSVFATLFLVAFMLWRDGPRGTLTLYARMGWQGLAVGACFAVASISFVIAIGYTTVANVILLYSTAPFLAAVIGWALYGMRVSRATWLAIAASVAGVAVMVSGGGALNGSAIGNLLALLMTAAFAVATVITRRYDGVRMTPAVSVGGALAAAVAAVNAGGFAAGAQDFVLLFAFGALNLGLGMALFVTGARLIPAALAALIGMVETVLSPGWVWLIHGEAPDGATLVGGAIVVAALLANTLWEVRRQDRPAPVATTPTPGP